MRESERFFRLRTDLAPENHVEVQRRRGVSSFPDLSPQLAEIIWGEFVPDYVPGFVLARGAKDPMTILCPGIGYILRERVWDLWLANRVTGFRSFPVDLLNRFGCVVEQGHMLGVTGRCGRLRHDVTMPDQTGAPVPFVVYRGIDFDVGTWDGSDVFCADTRDNTFVAASRRLRDVCARAAVKGVAFEDPAAIEWPSALQPTGEPW
jgi:hypothetical protein